MRVICAWCEKEGRSSVLGEKEPLDDPAPTHGICRRHEEALFSRRAAKSFPGVRLLLVVAPGETKLHEYMTRTLAAAPGVQVIMERRRGERRQERLDVPEERRGRQRRQRHVRRLRSGTGSSASRRRPDSARRSFYKPHCPPRGSV